jgi:hypothetical protein
MSSVGGAGCEAVVIYREYPATLQRRASTADAVKAAIPTCWVVAESDLSGRLVGSKPEAKTEAGGVA